MKSVLITGITGFVGRSLVHYFMDNEQIRLLGYSRDEAKAIQSFTGQHIRFIPTLSAEEFDLNQVDTIIHLAGIAHDLSGKYSDQDYIDVNFHQTVKLYDEFSRSSTKRFVFVSSIKAVTDHSNNIIDENTSPNPTSPYGVSKRKAEQYLSDHPVNAKEVLILRPCMIHGPGNKGNLNLLYKFISKGLPYPLGSFENRRSFLSIDNFNFVIGKILGEQLTPGEYLLADSETISTNDLIRLIGREIGKKVTILRLPAGMVRSIAHVGSMFHAKFNRQSLQKLTENMMVSNRKLLLNLKHELPVTAEEGLVKTIRSFNE